MNFEDIFKMKMQEIISQTHIIKREILEVIKDTYLEDMIYFTEDGLGCQQLMITKDNKGYHLRELKKIYRKKYNKELLF
jgi:hypothetical protein